MTAREIWDLFSNESTLHFLQFHEILLGCVLLICVISYAYLHKRIGKSAIFFMASCRFMLIVFAASTAYKTFLHGSIHYGPRYYKPLVVYFDWLENWVIVLALAVGFYTLLLSWVASTESEKGAFNKRQILSGLFIAIPAITFVFQALILIPDPDHYHMWSETDYNHLFIRPVMYHGAFYTALAVLCGWLFFTLYALRTSKPIFVSRALAGFCLLDAAFIAVLSPTIALICLGFFVLALLLQRVAPAT